MFSSGVTAVFRLFDMSSPRRLLLLNQMAGPLFRQLAEGLSSYYPDGAVLVTGHPDTLSIGKQNFPSLNIVQAPEYNRRSIFHRFYSWISYLIIITPHIIFARHDDFILLVSNPPLLGPWVWFLTRIRPVPYSVLVYDIYPDVLFELGLINRFGLISTLWTFMNRLVYKNSASIITIGHRMAKRIQMQLGKYDLSVSVVPPWSDTNLIKPLTRDLNPFAAQFVETNEIVVLYSGNIGSSHDIESILCAAELLQSDSRIRFVFIGDGAKCICVKDYILRYPDGNVKYYPFQPEAMLPYTLPLGDISLVSLDDGFEELMLPSKFFSYLAAGSAILAIANDHSEVSDLIHTSQCGLCVPPRKPALLASALLKIIDSPGMLASFKHNSRFLSETKYSIQAGVTSFADILGIAKSSNN